MQTRDRELGLPGRLSQRRTGYPLRCGARSGVRWTSSDMPRDLDHNRCDSPTRSAPSSIKCIPLAWAQATRAAKERLRMYPSSILAQSP
jgi:hypothetical protein